MGYLEIVEQVRDRLIHSHRWERVDWPLPYTYKCKWCDERYAISKDPMDSEGIAEEIKNMKARRDCKGEPNETIS